MNRTTRALAPLAATLAAAALAADANAHAHVSPSVVSSKASNVMALTVPTEKEGVTTTAVELTPPDGFSIDAFAPSPGWKRDVVTSGSGESTRIDKVTWSGGGVPTDESAFFQFVGEGDANQSYKFDVRQTYSDGEVVNWSGPESSDTPAPVVEAKSLGGGGSSTLPIVALVVGALGVLLAAVALVARGGVRPLA